MSEKIFAFLLRFYPAGFRRQYQDEAIGLLRDRLRDERGMVPRFRLFYDLLADFVSGLPQAYRNSYSQTAIQPATGIPVFRVLDEEPLRPGSVILGGVLALGALSAFVFVMNHASAYHPFSRVLGLGSHPQGQVSPTAEQAAEKIEEQIRTADAVQSCGFEKLELHPGEIGYVKLNSFPNPARCGQIVDAVMTRLNPTHAIIFDLRDNRGGFPQTVRQIGDYLFDRPVSWYDPRAESPEQSLTHSPVPGSRLASKPVFILTSSRTFSAAEHFTYDLKALKRATVVGEKTSGASHVSPLPQMGVKPRWEGSGVEPDVKVKADDALNTAEKLALSAIAKQ